MPLEIRYFLTISATLKAVSYTHLDVYKRQAPRGFLDRLKRRAAPAGAALRFSQSPNASLPKITLIRSFNRCLPVLGYVQHTQMCIRDRDRTMQAEYYGVKVNAGVKINF